MPLLESECMATVRCNFPDQPVHHDSGSFGQRVPSAIIHRHNTRHEDSDDEVSGNTSCHPQLSLLHLAGISTTTSPSNSGKVSETGAAHHYLDMENSGTNKHSNKADEFKSLILNVINLSATSFGSAMLSLPYSFSIGGLIPGILSLLGVCLLSIYSTSILTSTARATGQATYSDLVAHFYGEKGRIFTKAALVSCLFVTALTYLVAMRELIEIVLAAYTDGLDHAAGVKPIIIGCIILLVFPANLATNLSSLANVSWVAVLSAYLISFIVFGKLVAYVAQQQQLPDVQIHLLPQSITFLYMLPIQAFSFAYHYLWFESLADLKAPTPIRTIQLGASSQALCFIPYLVISVSGYLLFGEGTTGDIFHSFEPSDTAAVVGRVAAASTLLFSFPLLIVPLRDHLLSAFNLTTGRRVSSITVVALSSLLFVGASVLPDLAVANSVAGTIVAVVVFILPGILRWRTSKTIQSQATGVLLALVGVLTAVGGILYSAFSS